MQRAVAVHLDARLLHQVEQILFHFQAADQSSSTFTRTPALARSASCSAILRPISPGPVDVGFEVDGVPGGADRRQHGGEDFGTVLQITRTWLPGTMAGPSNTPISRRNWGSDST